MRFRAATLITAAVLTAAAATVIADHPKCTTSSRECETMIRKMMTAGRRYLGVDLVELNPGLIVKSVKINSPAHRGGLLANDRLIAVNGKSLTLATAREFKQILSDASRTGVLFMIVQRRGAYKQLDLRLEPYPKDQVDKIVSAHIARSHTTATAGGQ